MSKFYIDSDGWFYYGDKPDDIETVEADEQQIKAHLLSSAKKSKISEITSAYYQYIQNIFLTDNELNSAKTKCQELTAATNNASTLEEIETITINLSQK